MPLCLKGRTKMITFYNRQPRMTESYGGLSQLENTARRKFTTDPLSLNKIKVCLPFWPENWEGRYVDHPFFLLNLDVEKCI